MKQEAVSVLQDAAEVMLKANQTQSAFDLMDQLLKIQKEQGQIAKLFRLCPDSAKPDFIAKACKYDKSIFLRVFAAEYYRLDQYWVRKYIINTRMRSIIWLNPGMLSYLTQ